MAKIRVNQSNSKVMNGRLFITMLKAQQIKSKVLSALIEYGNSIVYPNVGKLVEYKGAYIRVSQFVIVYISINQPVRAFGGEIKIISYV